MPHHEEIAGKRVVSCTEIGILGDCDFRAIGDSDDEVFMKLVNHLKEKHDTVIPPGSHLDSIIRRFIHVIGTV